ncbi:ATP-binding protein [Vibrio sp. 99-70-13A1]|uniref:PAS domain-containing sensor histidine kinase n=1 Tax=Vibrio sp. 99-70-13A1 TaxID=2607601 RepID=UPI0014935E2B|nr:ATP-binding protein [Vibrio sp. 99-70-13A1]NOH98066.1 ATP-binding protein [Vibrio sp. 99-70-13A1]
MSRTKKFEDSDSNPIYSRIGRRIILIMVILSGAVTLLATTVQLYWDYSREFSGVEQRQQEIESVHAELLAASLWSYDLVLLQQKLEGLVNLPKVNYLEIRSGSYTFIAGEKVTKYPIQTEFELQYHSPIDNQLEALGSLYMESNGEEIYSYLLRQFLLTLAINAIKTTIVCYLILMVFHKNVNRRIFAVATYLRKFNPRHPSDPLKLPYHPWVMEQDDELNWLADETNKITGNIRTLYNNIRFEQERFVDFANVSSDWLWETDEIGRLVFVSEAMQLALNIDIHQHPFINDVDGILNAYRLCDYMSKQKDFSMCEVNLEIDGQTFYMFFQGMSVLEENKFKGYRGSSINVTALKDAQLRLEDLNQNLEIKVAERTRDLEQSMQSLEEAQGQLVESEKLAALGGLVAGVAHEVNTPLGIAVTASSLIKESCNELNSAFTSQTLTSQQFEQIMQQMNQASVLLEDNLNRGAKLIRDFKQTAVDQVSESRSQFNVKQTLDALITSIHPETRKVPVTPQLNGDSSVTMNSLPGVLTQVVSNLILNSVNHAFSEKQDAQIELNFHEEGDCIIFIYRDNGCGVDSALHQKIFEPFFTSKRGQGGSGLGLNLVFNLVHQKLSGQLSFESELGDGVTFTFSLPRDLPMNDEELNKP